MSPFDPFKNFFGIKNAILLTSNHLFGRDEYYKHVFMRAKKVLGIRLIQSINPIPHNTVCSFSRPCAGDEAAPHQTQ